MTKAKKTAKARVWTVQDFAEHIGISHCAARSRLKKLNAQMGGKLLEPSMRRNRGYTFLRAKLAKAHPEYFESVESLEGRVEELEERLEEALGMITRLATQVGANTKGLDWLRSAMKPAVRRAA